jgi:predicted nucleic acid-binding protein
MAGPRREARQAPQRLILDSGAVIALSRGDRRARAYLARALEVGALVEIPVVVIAETVRGGPRDAPVHRVLKAVGRIPEAREIHGRIAGRLLGAARSAHTVDALVVAHAVEGGGAHVLTGDPDDLSRLATPHPEVSILPL